MRIFLTGATGFIGSHVARQLVAEGDELFVLVRPNANVTRIRDVEQRLKIFRGYASEAGKLRSQIEGFAPEACIHLAWESPGKLGGYAGDIRSLSDGLEMLAALNDVECPYFFTTGTYTEYCSSDQPVKEDAPVCPTTFYAEAKYSLERLAAQFQREHRKSFCSARLFNVYGPSDNERRMIPSIISSIRKGELCQLRTGGQQIRDFLHVEDVASAICALVKVNAEGIVNVGSSEPKKASEVANLVAELMGRPELLKLSSAPLPEHEAKSLVADNQHLRSLTKWQPKYDLRSGLEKTIQIG